jgi:flagellar basal body L-ring protein FlgH
MNYMPVIDRIEEDWAVIEYGKKTFNIPRSLLPKGAKEGDVITVLVTVDESATKRRSDDIKALAKDLFED